MTMGDARDQRPDLSGVGGWLLFLCILLMVVLPIQIALLLVAALRSTTETSAVAAGLLVVILVFFGTGVVAGVLLYRENPLGLLIAKIWFGLRILIASAPVLLDPATVLVELPGAILFTIGVPAAWLIYLFRSERVRNTYSRVQTQSTADVFR